MEKTENKEIQRIMIAECADEINQKKNNVQSLLITANELSELYKGLNMGVFTADDLKDAICNNARGIKLRYIEQAKAEAGELHITSLRDEVIKEAEQFQNPFQERVSRLKRSVTSPDRELLKYLTVTDTGEVVFTDENEKALEEDTHVYLTDPEQIDKYMIHQDITRLLNDFFENGDGLPIFWWQMFPLRDGVFVMPENGANYAGMLEQAARKRGVSEYQSLNPGPTGIAQDKPKKETPKQQNRQLGGMTKGISKEPDYVGHTGRRAGRGELKNIITVQKGTDI